MTTILAAGGWEFAASAPATPVDGGWILDAAAPVTVGHPFGATRYYRHGWHSWSLSHWADLRRPAEAILVPAARAHADDPAHVDDPGHSGSWVGAVEGPDGTALVLGALGLGTRVAGDARRLRGTAEGRPCEWFVGFGPAEEVLAAYAGHAAARFGNARRDPGRVWCSWYSHYRAVTEDIVAEVLAGLAGLDFDVVQIDDGWQLEVGDWEANPTFPSGMAAVAGRIAEAGYRPGLWAAPFAVHERSRVFRDHPDWMVAGDDGAPRPAGNNWGGPFYGLDLTRPEVRDHVRAVISRAIGWGFAYLKLDFLYAAAIPGRRHGAGNREDVYRSGIELIRATAGDGAYLLACGSPVLPSIGVFNGMRVGPDVAPWWELDLNDRFVRDLSYPSTRYAVSTSHARLWLRDVVATDPDVAYFRSRYALLTPEQRRLHADLCLIAGFRATSDPPGWLDAAERAELAAFLAAPGVVERRDRYRFRVDGREVDFSAATLDHPVEGGR